MIKLFSEIKMLIVATLSTVTLGVVEFLTSNDKLLSILYQTTIWVMTVIYLAIKIRRQIKK